MFSFLSYSSHEKMWSISWMFVLEAVVIVAGNVTTIVIFTTTPRLQSRQYVLIVSLAVADLLIGVISVPFHILFSETSLSQYEPFLLVYFMQDMFLGTASLLGLVALAIERLHATYFPFRHLSMSNVPYIVGITVVWFLSFAVCMASYVIRVSLFTYFIIKIVVVTVPLLVIIIAYVLIYYNVRCQSGQNGPQNAEQNNQQNRKLTSILALVTAVSLIAWMPYQLTVVYSTVMTVFLESCWITSFPQSYWIIRGLFKVLHFGNSWANFFVFALRMREFKAELIRRFTCCRQNHVDPQ